MEDEAMARTVAAVANRTGRAPLQAALVGLVGAGVFFAIRRHGGPGSALKRLTSAFGFKPCGGCERRAEKLDRWFSPQQYRVRR
jgi:hypothetical protein